MYEMTELPQLIEANKQIEPGIRDSSETPGQKKEELRKPSCPGGPIKSICTSCSELSDLTKVRLIRT